MNNFEHEVEELVAKYAVKLNLGTLPNSAKHHDNLAELNRSKKKASYLPYPSFERSNQGYRTKHKADFKIYPPDYPSGILIECKYQKVSGSADQKVLSAALLYSMQDIPTIIVMNDDFNCSKNLQYDLKGAYRDSNDTVKLMNLTEFKHALKVLFKQHKKTPQLV